MGAEKQHPSLHWGYLSLKIFENADVPDSIDDEIPPGLKSSGSKYVAAKGWCIFFDTPLPEILQCLARVRITAPASDLVTQIIAESPAAPSERVSDGDTDRRFSAADLTGKTK
ncbi:hypothetical protein [Bradyrhizobium sp. OK095]|uniref:hypothetical protein n=1 Tax=Bradyrhizobium sp. OK095 TaxID=1882760 RepID=UPI00115FC9AA|nr:hypothetical protein [Bradyrhizobium sp. OK095]